MDFGEEKEPDYRIIVYTAYMIASLKKDFTGYDISPRENITKIKNRCIDFIENFDNPDNKNLLFIGNTGLR